MSEIIFSELKYRIKTCSKHKTGQYGKGMFDFSKLVIQINAILRNQESVMLINMTQNFFLKN